MHCPWTLHHFPRTVYGLYDFPWTFLRTVHAVHGQSMGLFSLCYGQPISVYGLPVDMSVNAHGRFIFVQWMGTTSSVHGHPRRRGAAAASHTGCCPLPACPDVVCSEQPTVDACIHAQSKQVSLRHSNAQLRSPRLHSCS
jgi:hypothetical protein